MSQLFFRTSGLRGKVHEIINPELAIRIGRAFAQWIKKKHNVSDYYVYLGYDNRRNSKSIADCLCAALSASGINVIQFSEAVPTPLVIYATVNNESHGGVMITGSHLPAEDNGVILFDNLGNYFKGVLEDTSDNYIEWSKTGKITEGNSEIIEYRVFLTEQARKLGVTKNNWKVLIDTVHGPMREYLKLAVNQFTDDLEMINEEFDDTFPGRISEPTPNSIIPARDRLIEKSCDLGIATDMDGDRVLFITKSGKIITGDYLGAILANIFWHEYPETPIVAPINTSGVIEVAATKANGKIHYCKVGPPSIILAVRETSAKFGFEETGKYVFSDIGIWPDAAITTLFLISLLQKTGNSLDSFVDQYIQLFSLKEKVSAPLNSSQKLMEILIKECNMNSKTLHEFISKLINKYHLNIDLNKYSPVLDYQFISINSMDGLRINLENNSYLMIRPSGTENYIRIFCEHPHEKIVRILNDLGKTITNELLNYLN